MGLFRFKTVRSIDPKELLEKANHRSWTEFASDITMNMFAMLYVKDEKEFFELKNKVAEQFSQVEKAIDADGPYFSGRNFSLVDTAYAPIFSRLKLVDQVYALNLLSKRLAYWSEHSLKRASVKNSVVDNFDELFMEYTRNTSGYLSTQFLSL
ncbi:MAG: glutathione S-transferase domain-containing protein [Gammaproteobacteria bacterium]|nr:glutathione S-transferase domain-containing protein [Gammaproteobacteria bacterium]